MRLIRSLLLAATALCASHAWAYSTVDVQYLEDRTRTLEAQDIIQRTDWKTSTAPITQFGYSDSRFWLRFKLPHVPNAEGGIVYLDIPFIYLEKVQLYSVESGKLISHGMTGQGVPLASRALRRPNYGYRLQIPSDPNAMFYLSAESHFPIQIPIEIRNREEAGATLWNMTFFIGAFFGCLAVAALFNGFLALALRSRLYLYYSLFVLSIGLLYMANEGLTVQFLWPDSPHWALVEMHVFGALSFLLYVFFVREFIEIRKLSIWLDRLMLGLVVISTARAIWLPFQPNLPVEQVGEAAIVFGNFFALAIAGIGTAKRLRSARYFLFSSAAFNITIVLYLLQSAGLFWLGKWVNYAPYAGTVIEITLLSIALADRIRVTNAQMVKVNRDLQEQKVTTIQAEKMTALGRMAAGIAHEINNPLTIIHGRAAQLKRLAQNPDRQQIAGIADNIEKTALRISKIIKSMKALSRDSISDPLEQVLVSAILQDTLSLCTERFHNEGIELKVHPPEKDFEIRCRSAEICQVLINLLNNARDAAEETPERWVKIHVNRNSGFAEFSIVDSGKGIPFEIQDQIQEPFFTTKKVGRGTGLGLSISKTLVENHGGQLWLDTASSNTRFVFTVPC